MYDAALALLIMIKLAQQGIEREKISASWV